MISLSLSLVLCSSSFLTLHSTVHTLLCPRITWNAYSPPLLPFNQVITYIDGNFLHRRSVHVKRFLGVLCTRNHCSSIFVWRQTWNAMRNRMRNSGWDKFYCIAMECKNFPGDGKAVKSRQDQVNFSVFKTSTTVLMSCEYYGQISPVPHMVQMWDSVVSWCSTRDAKVLIRL